jgi:hypothetical protein
MFNESIPTIDLPGYTLVKKFTSRKNSVFLVENTVDDDKPKHLVYKKYAYSERMQAETEMLRLLKVKGVAVPEIYWTGQDHLLLEYIEGPLLLDCYCRQEDTCDHLDASTHQLINSLCSWFKDFYSAVQSIYGKQILMGDVNFRNFIIGEKVFGLDLEECHEGRIEKEVGSLCAFALTYNPSFTMWKMAIVSDLIRVFTYELNLDRKILQKEVENELLFLAQIRGTVEKINIFLATNSLDNIFKYNGS